MSKYEMLFSPMKVGSLELKNRIAMSPMGNRYPTFGGEVTQRMIDYYAERAAGGTGLIIVEFTAVTSDGRGGLYTPGIWSDHFIPGLKALTKAVKEKGAKIAIQLAHAGGKTHPEFKGYQVVAPSPIPFPGAEVPIELSLERIKKIHEDFVQAALRAKEAGFDAVELHIAHSYLLNQFISPYYNHRKDQYGGDVNGRARLPVEILREIKEKAGKEYPVLCRICGNEEFDGGITLDELKTIAVLLEKAGADLIDIGPGARSTSQLTAPPMSFPDGYYVPLAQMIKEVISIPVMTGGKIHNPDLAEKVLLEGKADFIAIGRGLIADPGFANKAKEGRNHEIRPCLACNNPECHGRIHSEKQLSLACVVNPLVGRESISRSKRASKSFSVIVVGGGPAGMEAAKVAAYRGHRVILFEKENELGGQLRFAAAPPYKEKLRELINYYGWQLESLGVEVRTGEAIDADLMLQLNPDRIIMATGSLPLIPKIAGTDGRLASAWDVLCGKVEVGSTAAVIGGGDVGCETAEFLGQRGVLVTVLEMLGNIAPQMVPWNRTLLLNRLLSLKVDLRLYCKAVALEGNRLIYEQEGVRFSLDKVDSVVAAVGSRPNDNLANEFLQKGIKVSLAGDCISPRNIAAAVREGFEQAWNLS